MGHANTLFNGAADQSLIRRITPTTEQRDFLQRHWNELAEHLKSALADKHGYSISTWLQGSYKFGTLIKPVRARDEYDVDVGVYFNWIGGDGGQPTPRQLRGWVQDELLEYAKKCADLRSVAIPPKDRCSRASYVRQFHIDTPVYHLDSERDERRLACLPGQWEPSDPKKIYEWFRNAVDSDDRDQLRRIVRYFKAWAAISFEDIPTSRPASILLTVLATNAYISIRAGQRAPIDDDDMLVSAIKQVHRVVAASNAVANPTDADEPLNRMSDVDWGGFAQRLNEFLTIAQRAEEADDEISAALIWSEAFSFLMPLPETDQIEVSDNESQQALMPIPDIDIAVYSRNPKRFVDRYRNEVPGVAKDCDLVFSIVAPHLVPTYATIEWTVRNSGEDADWHSDLGHRQIAMRLLTAEEHTKYAGLHFMDCVIRNNGGLYAARRVPVTIRDVQRVVRNPPRPAYSKLRTRRR